MRTPLLQGEAQTSSAKGMKRILFLLLEAETAEKEPMRFRFARGKSASVEHAGRAPVR